MRRFIIGTSIVIAAASGFVVGHATAAAEGTPSMTTDRTQAQEFAPMPAYAFGSETEGVARWIGAEQLHRWYEAVAQNVAEQENLRKTQPKPSTATGLTPVSQPSGSSGGGFLACTRAHESDTAGGYQAVSPGGQYRGAYQFSPSTWDNTASHAGRADLIGEDPAQASPADQDAMASALYAWQGSSPWGGRCG